MGRIFLRFCEYCVFLNRFFEERVDQSSMVDSVVLRNGMVVLDQAFFEQDEKYKYEHDPKIKCQMACRDLYGPDQEVLFEALVISLPTEISVNRTSSFSNLKRCRCSNPINRV